MLDETLQNTSFENNIYLIGEAIYTIDCLIREERNKQLNNVDIDVFASQYMTFADFYEIKYIENCAINGNIDYLNETIFANDYVANYILEKGYFLENVFDVNLINQDILYSFFRSKCCTFHRLLQFPSKEKYGIIRTQSARYRYRQAPKTQGTLAWHRYSP